MANSNVAHIVSKDSLLASIKKIENEKENIDKLNNSLKSIQSNMNSYWNDKQFVVMSNELDNVINSFNSCINSLNELNTATDNKIKSLP